MSGVWSEGIVETLPLFQLGLEINIALILDELVKLFLVRSMGSFYFSV